MGLISSDNKKLKLVAATRNRGKLEEIADFLRDLPLEVVSLLDFSGIPDIEETGATFEENALLKAQMVAAYTGNLTLADDSGLEVDCLRGAPGVYSARFAGEPASDERNNQKLLKLMEDVPPPERGARFVCVMALVLPDGNRYLARGRCEGMIAREPAGYKGFGYDPLFYLPQLGKTMAELDLAVKNRISHRARALTEAREILIHLLKEAREGAQ